MPWPRNDARTRDQHFRARLLEAATALLRSGGPSAVTVDAVTRGANVARATLYRHFPSGNDLLAAAFNSLIAPAPMPSDNGPLRDRLVAVVLGFGQSIAEAPGALTAMSWLALGATWSSCQNRIHPYCRQLGDQHTARAHRPAVCGAVRCHLR